MAHSAAHVMDEAESIDNVLASPLMAPADDCLSFSGPFCLFSCRMSILSVFWCTPVSDLTGISNESKETRTLVAKGRMHVAKWGG